MVRIYGIRNCDAMKKAFRWMEERGIPYEFHDYGKLGVPRERLVAWCRALGWKTLLNTKGTTWRKLAPEAREIATQSQAVATMVAHPSVIRRPLVDTGDGHLLVGFDPTLFESFVK